MKFLYINKIKFSFYLFINIISLNYFNYSLIILDGKKILFIIKLKYYFKNKLY